jgi:protein-S-isoprenylcysteine O-methyltransferase Ste14
MSLTGVIFIIWAVFWVGWLLAALTAKRGPTRRRVRAPTIILVVVFVLLRAFRTSGLPVHSPALKAVGLVVFVIGLAVAVWARICLGRNWGMPMSEKDEPELVTSGPYRFVRNPIYTGLLLGVLGTALATNLVALVAFAVLGAYFIYSAKVEEGILVKAFPTTYPSYRARTKLLIPFLL